MALKLVCLAFCLKAAVSASPDARIVGGTPTTIYEYPFIVSIEYYYPAAELHVQRCVGSLISSWHVLTTAYCLVGANLENMQVRIGSTTSLSGGTVVSIQDVIKHPYFQETPREEDIAIVVLSKAIGVTDAVNVIYLPPQQTQIPDGYPVKIASWGFESEEGPQIQVLKTIESNTIPLADCEAAYEDSESVTIYDYVICTAAEGTSMCGGDSGAPMVIGETLVGLSSYYGTCDDSTPNVFTRIDRHTGWILEQAVTPASSAGVPVRVASF